MSEFARFCDEPYTIPKTTEIVIPVMGHGEQHIAILRNFSEAILDGKPLMAPASEGLRSVELANAILLSTFENRTVELPIEAKHYHNWLQRKIADPRGKSQAAPALSAEASLHQPGGENQHSCL